MPRFAAPLLALLLAAAVAAAAPAVPADRRSTGESSLRAPVRPAPPRAGTAEAALEPAAAAEDPRFAGTFEVAAGTGETSLPPSPDDGPEIDPAADPLAGGGDGDEDLGVDEREEVVPTVAGIDLARATPENRVKIRELLAEYRTQRARSGVAYSLYIYGRVQALAGDLKAARQTMLDLLDRHPSSRWAPAARETIAELYVLEEKPDEAVREYGKILETAPLTDARRKEIYLRMARIYGGRLTSFERILEAYRQIASKPQYDRARVIRYLGGFFKGYHLLKAHFAVKYYDLLVRRFPAEPEADEARFRLGMIFGYDLSDDARALRYFGEVIRSPRPNDDLKRRATLLSGLLEQFRPGRPHDYAAFPFHYALLDAGGTDEIRAAAVFYLSRMFEESAARLPPDPSLSVADLAGTAPVMLKRLLFDRAVHPERKAFALLVENLDADADGFYAGLSAVRLAGLLAFRHGRTEPVGLVRSRLVARHPASPWLAEIDKILTYALPKLYDPAFTRAFAEANRLYEEGEFEKAMATLQGIVDAGGEGPEAEWAFFSIARIVEEDLADAPRAIERYRDFLARFPRSSRRDKVRYQIARIYENALLDYNKARELYEEIVATSEDQMWVFQAGLSIVALLKDVFNKPADAAKIYEALLEKCPARRDEIVYRLAKMKEEAKKRDEALKLFREIVDGHPESPFFDEALQAIVDSRLRERLGDLDKLIQRGGAGTGEVAALLERKLDQQIRLKEFDEALRTIDGMIAKAPPTAEVAALTLRKAKVLAEMKDKAEEAVKLAARAVELAEDPDLRADALYFVGQVHEFKTGNWARAKEVYDLILKDQAVREAKGPVRMNALYRRGVIAALKEKDLDQAYELYRELITRYGEAAKKAGLLDKVQNLLNADVTRILLTGDTDAAAEALGEGAEPDTAEALLTGGATIESAAPSAGARSFGPWFRPVRVDAPRDPGTWFSGAWADDPGLFWARGKGAPGWFSRRRGRDDRDPDEVDAEEIARQEKFLERLSFEANVPPVDSPKTVYYLDWLARNAPGEKTPVVLLALARSHEESNDLTRALAACAKILADHPASPEAAEAAALEAVLRAKAGDFAAAREGLDAHRRAGRLDDAAREKARKRVDTLERMREAEDYVNAHPGDPRSLEFLVEQARLAEKELGDLGAAVAAYNRAAAFTAGETEEVGFKKEIIRLSLARRDLETADEEYVDILARFRDMDGFDAILMDYAQFLIKERKAKEEAIPVLRELRDRYPGSPLHGKALELLAENLPDDDLAERRGVYQALVDASPDLKLRTKFAESIRLLGVREKIRDIRALIDRKLGGCSRHGKKGAKGCGECAALAESSADATEAREPDLFAWFKYVARLEERELEDRKAAIATIEEMISHGPPPAMKREAVLKLGDLLAAERRHTEAAEMFRRQALQGFDRDPGFAAYLQFLCARAFEEAGKFDEAKEEYRKTSLFFPFSEWATNAKLALASFEGRVRERREEKAAEAERERKKYDFELKEKEGTAPVELAGAEPATTDEAKLTPEQRLERLYARIDANDKAPDVPRLLLQAANLERQLNREDRMMEAWKRIVDNFPQYPDYYNIVFLMAEEYKRAGNLAEAIPLYKKIADEQPQFNRTEYVQHTLGKLYSQTGDFIYALDVFRKLIDNYQDHEYAKDAQFEVAVIRERDLREYDQAIEEYQKMADRYFDHPRAVDAQISVGRIYETVKNDYPAAKRAYEAVLEKFPNTPRRREVTLAIERVTRMIR